MKAFLLVPLALCAAACVDGRSSYGRVKLADGLEFHFEGGFTAHTSASSTAVRMTYMGRAIHYEGGALYVDDRPLNLPAEARVVAFDGPSIYVDGRSIDLR